MPALTLPTEPLSIDNTKRSTANGCLRKYYYKHIAGIEPTQGSTALRYGICWHEAMDAFYSYIAEHGWTKDGKALEAAILSARAEWDYYSSKQTFIEDYRNIENLMKSLLQYISTFSFDEGMLQVRESEGVFSIPIEPTQEELQLYPFLKPFNFTGIIDLDVILSGSNWIIDHKTTGKSISMVSNTLHRSPQFKGYTFAAEKKLKERIEGFLVVIHHLSARKRKTGEYGEPSIDFSRVPQIYTSQDITAWKHSLLETANRIHLAHATGNFPMQDDTCYTFGQCTYSQLCEQHRPLGDEVLDGNFHLAEPWDVAKENTRRSAVRKEILNRVRGVQ